MELDFKLLHKLNILDLSSIPVAGNASLNKPTAIDVKGRQDYGIFRLTANNTTSNAQKYESN